MDDVLLFPAGRGLGAHRWLLLVSIALAGLACARPAPKLNPGGQVERGVASWYGPDFHGRRTANGERYDMHALTAAHPSLPFDTLVEVRNLDNGRTVQVRINDRGPFKKGRVIDLSYAAATELDMVPDGTARVELVMLGQTPPSFARFTVQVGAFQERERADAVARDLCERQPGAEVRSDGLWHRVQIGKFAARELAEDLRRQLTQQGIAALVVALP